jgi:hypothetical protein
MSTGSVVPVTRWVARVWSVLSIIAVLFFSVNELLPSAGPPPTLQEWLGLTLFPIGLSVGLVMAWYREELGGILALGCLIAFYVWLLHSGHLLRGTVFPLVAAPGFLFLLTGFLSRRSGAFRKP